MCIRDRLIVVPSRIDVEHYEMMKNQIESLVGRINGKFGSPDWTPIIYMFKTLTFEPLVEVYASSHIALITPLRDGMNLIAKEYIASRTDKTGVLILSEMAGASKELLEAVITNPNNRNEIADALLEALNMPEEEQIRRNAIMQLRLQRYDVVRWAADFIQELNRVKAASRKFSTKGLTSDDRNKIISHYHKSKQRLLLLDYDGTLVPFATLPNKATPGQFLMEILRALCDDPGNSVVIISGRERKFLDYWFSNLNIGLAAEHGAWIKKNGSEWQMAATTAIDWKPKLKPLFEHYVDRVAGSFVEEKDFALVWHYRGSELEPGKLAAQELKDHLLALTANIDVHIIQGNRTVEARVAGVNKGTGGLRFFSEESYDFILCLGDDTTDEDLFAVLPERAYTIRVGFNRTCATRTIGSVADVLALLDQLQASHVGQALLAN
jgi:trehalose 6-phosphate synthase/phosphatase